jgi:hypothetical protein
MDLGGETDANALPTHHPFPCPAPNGTGESGDNSIHSSPSSSSSPSAIKQVRWCPVLSQTMPYHFFDPTSGEVLEGRAARDQAKRDVLGDSWQETWDIVSRDFRGRVDTVDTFLALEDAVAELPEPCLCLVGQQWRYVGGDRPRPCESNLDDGVGDATDALADRTALSPQPRGTPSSDAEDDALWGAELQFSSEGHFAAADCASLYGFPTPEEYMLPCTDTVIDIPADHDGVEWNQGTTLTLTHTNRDAGAHPLASPDLEMNRAEAVMPADSLGLFSTDGTLYYGDSKNHATACSIDTLLKRDRAETTLSQQSPQLGAVAVHPAYRAVAPARSHHASMAVPPTHKVKTRPRSSRGYPW